MLPQEHSPSNGQLCSSMLLCCQRWWRGGHSLLCLCTRWSDSRRTLSRGNSEALPDQHTKGGTEWPAGHGRQAQARPSCCARNTQRRSCRSGQCHGQAAGLSWDTGQWCDCGGEWCNYGHRHGCSMQICLGAQCHFHTKRTQLTKIAGCLPNVERAKVPGCLRQSTLYVMCKRQRSSALKSLELCMSHAFQTSSADFLSRTCQLS